MKKHHPPGKQDWQPVQLPSSAPRSRHRLKNSRQILNLGRRSAARWPEQHNPGGPHLSGKAHYLKMVASQNKRFGTYQAPVPAAREYGVPGARVDVLTKWKGGAGPDGRGDSIGAFSERRFDLEARGGPVLKLIWQNAVIDAAGIATVRKHVDRYGEDPENEAMIARLEHVLAGKSPATDWDKRYYTYELERFRGWYTWKLFRKGRVATPADRLFFDFLNGFMI